MMLFHVQDVDRPMHVVADSWQGAVSAWREQIAKENPEVDEHDDPDGIALVATNIHADMPEILIGELTRIREAIADVDPMLVAASGDLYHVTHAVAAICSRYKIVTTRGVCRRCATCRCGRRSHDRQP